MQAATASKQAGRSRELYQQTVIVLLGARQTQASTSAVDFVANHGALVGQLRERWLALEEEGALPSPDQILSWL